MSARVRLLAVSVLGGLAFSNAGAVVSQVPLTGSSLFVAPNLMFTLDDSGSMDFECVPDALCVNGARYIGVAPVEFATFKNAVATFATGELFARQMRSSVNPLYYNPAVRYQPWLQADGSRFPVYPETAAPPNPQAPGVTVNLALTQSATVRWCRSTTSCAIGTETFAPAQYYLLAPGRTGNALGDFTQVLIEPATVSYPKGVNRTDCASASSCTYAEEIQNFSNWFTYARTRLKVAIGGTAEAFAAVPAAYRVGFGTINSVNTTVDGVAGNTIRSGVRPFSGVAKNNFYATLHNATSQTGGTPLRRAMDDVGQYFSRADHHAPWAADPAVGETPASHLSCRRSFHVLMTDGMWNSAGASTPAADADVDNTSGPLNTHADGTTIWQYSPAAPYAAEGGSTLADAAMYYWYRDLRPDLANNIKHSTANPAFWQHMVNYTIAFGVNGHRRNPEDLPALTAGTLDWGTPSTDEPAKVDDLWHAAINSRGLARSAVDATEYGKALDAIISDIASRSGSEAGVAVSSRSYSATARKYIPTYNTSDWSGDVKAVRLSDGAKVWLASEQLPSPSARNVYTFKDTATKGVRFTLADLNTAGMTSLLGATDPAGLIDYLRGVRTGEGSTYRKRGTPLGDIVNSSPVLVKDLVDAQYSFLSASTAGQSSYLSFLAGKKARMPQLFVGSNDGMLHAFNDAVGTAAGAETFAFVPRAVLGRVRNLAEPSYAHRYLVDGPLAEVDVYDATAAKWRNLVVGAGGAGAKNLFAINVPVPAPGATVPLTDAQSAPGASDILWEISSDATGFAELGHVLQTPEAGILRDGRWVIAVGNGYDSASGRAHLYLIDAITGDRVAVLDTGVGSSAAPNGLGGVKLVRDSRQRIVAAYAGDLRGNLWKFDLSSATSSDWAVAFGGNPLFKATNGAGDEEPITAAPTYTSHPLRGIMVFAGAGKLFESGDVGSQAERSLYGVWDTVATGASSANAGDRVTDNATLVTQTITSLTVDGVAGKYYSVSNNSVDYGSGADAQKRGWKIRMTIEPGQRLIHDPQIEGGRVFFDTMLPGDTQVACSASSPQGLTFVLDPFTGAPGQGGPTFDTNGDGLFNDADSLTAAATRFASVGQRGLVRHPGSQVSSEGSGIGGGSSGGSAGSGSAGGGGDGAWDDKKRIQLARDAIRRQWRQIVTPPAY